MFSPGDKREQKTTETQKICLHISVNIGVPLLMLVQETVAVQL